MLTAYIKGAPERVLAKCSTYLKDGEEVPITETPAAEPAPAPTAEEPKVEEAAPAADAPKEDAKVEVRNPSCDPLGSAH